MNEFEKHYTEDLEPITLQGVTFHVKLPGQANKKFQRTVIAATVDLDDESGEYVRRDVSLEAMADIQIRSFVTTSIRRVDGWDDFTPEKLLALPDACEDLWAEVVQINNAREGEAAAAAKKSPPSSDGNSSGPAGADSMPNLHGVAS